MQLETPKYTRRVLSGFVDFICVYLVVFLLNLLVATPILNHSFQLDQKINHYNEIYQTEIINFGMGKLEGEEGKESLIIYSTFDLYLEGNNIDANQLSEEEKNTLLETYVSNFEELSKVFSEGEFATLRSQINTLQKVSKILCVTISELIFLLLVPYLNKKRKTIGNFAAQTIVLDRNSNELKSWQPLARFGVLWGIESVLMIWVFGDLALFLVPIISAVSLLATQNKNCIHDSFTHTRVVIDNPNSFVEEQMDAQPANTPILDLTEEKVEESHPIEENHSSESVLDLPEINTDLEDKKE